MFGLRVTPTLFLSPPSARRATSGIVPLPTIILDFYPRPPRGGRPCCRPQSAPSRLISIHALREEGDPGFRTSQTIYEISIHALREEGDAIASPQQ